MESFSYMHRGRQLIFSRDESLARREVYRYFAEGRLDLEGAAKVLEAMAFDWQKVRDGCPPPRVLP